MIMDSNQPIYVYESSTPHREGKLEGSIGPAILVLGGLATVGFWINDAIAWTCLVAAHPLANPYGAIVLAIVACVAAYYTWRTVRMAYLMTCALCFLTIDSYRKIRKSIRKRFSR
jgi:hypothetical protein